MLALVPRGILGPLSPLEFGPQILVVLLAFGLHGTRSPISASAFCPPRPVLPGICSALVVLVPVFWGGGVGSQGAVLWVQGFGALASSARWHPTAALLSLTSHSGGACRYAAFTGMAVVVLVPDCCARHASSSTCRLCAIAGLLGWLRYSAVCSVWRVVQAVVVRALSGLRISWHLEFVRAFWIPDCFGEFWRS